MAYNMARIHLYEHELKLILPPIILCFKTVCSGCDVGVCQMHLTWVPLLPLFLCFPTAAKVAQVYF